MPYGYEVYRLSKGISPKTTIIEVRLLHELLAFVNNKYKRKLEPREIKPIDIREFLSMQKEQLGLKDATVNRKLITIKNWFDYLWQIGKIEIDFMPKFTLPDKLELNKEKIEVNYEYLLSKQSEILQAPQILMYGKMLFLLYMRGFRVRDIVRITLEQIDDRGDSIIIQIEKSNGCNQRAQFENEEMGVILSCMERAIFRGTPYLLSSKVNDEFVPLQLGSFKDYLNSIKEHLGIPFRSEQIRLAYTHYLYTKKGLRAEDLQDILGLSLTSVTLTLKEALERIEEIDYNKQKAN